MFEVERAGRKIKRITHYEAIDKFVINFEIIFTVDV